MTAKEWLEIMQLAQDFPKGMEKLIKKYGEMCEKAAWDAAREEEDSDLPFPNQKYSSIEEWRETK